MARRITLGGKIGFAFIIYILFILFSSFFVAKRIDYSLYEVYDTMKGFLLFFYIVNNINSNQELKIVVYGVCLSGMLLSLFMIAQYVFKTNFTISGLSTASIWEIGPEGFRSRGFTGSPDESSTILLTVFQFFFVGVLLVKDKIQKSLISLVAFLFVMAIIFSKVRIAMAALGVGTITSLLLIYRRGWISTRQMFWTLLVCILAVMASIPFVYYRFAYGVYGEDRWPLMVTAYNMFKSNFMFGVGINNYNFVVLKYIPPDLASSWLYVVHNEYLLRLSETGVLGFLIYYFLVSSVVVGYYKLTFSKNRFISGTAVALFAVLIGSIGHRIVSIYHYEPFFLLECLTCALAPAMKFLENQTEKT
jgi:O-antigen ligase